MRIAIDYTPAARQRAGIGRYTRGLIHALARTDRVNEYSLFIPSDSRFVSSGGEALEGQGNFPPNFRLARAPLGERNLSRLWQRLSLPLPVELVTGRVQVFYSPDFVLPPTTAHKKILTVHDLSFKRVPETAVPNLKWYLEGAVPRAVRRADVVLADSDATRADLIELFGVPPERVQTLYSGVESFFCPVSDPLKLASVRERYKLTHPFVLSVGTIEPRKNLARLVEAFSLLKGASDLELVLAGGPGWMYEEIYAAPERFGIADRVRFLGFVPDEDLPALYSLASIFVYPSLYEGFGLPVLEAMACGAPVVASNTSSMPEVAGDAGLLVEPRQVDAIAGAMQHLLDDVDLRHEQARRGLERASGFSWEASARQLLQTFEES